MKTFKTTESQDRLAERLAATEWAPGKTFGGRWWGRGKHAERFYFNRESATIYKNGKPIRGCKVWLQFDDPRTLEGVSLHAVAKKAWHQEALAAYHAEATLIAIELVDPQEAARLRAELAAARDAEEQIGDLVAGEDEE